MSASAPALIVAAAVVLARVTISRPAPILMVPALAAMVAVSAPEPRVTFSRFEKLIEPNVPALAVETFRLWSAVLVEVKVSVPAPILSAVGSEPLRLVSLIVTASLPTLRLLIPAELKAVVTSAAVPDIASTALALMATVVLPSSVLRSAALTEESLTVME